MEEDDDGRGSLEFLQEVDEDGWGSIRTASFVEEDTNASESTDWRTTHKGREAQYGSITIFLRLLRQLCQ